MSILEEEELVRLLAPSLDELFQKALELEGEGVFRTYDLEKQKRILKMTFDIFWDKSKDKINGRLIAKTGSDQVLKSTIVQFSRDYIDQKIEEMNTKSR